MNDIKSKKLTGSPNLREISILILFLASCNTKPEKENNAAGKDIQHGIVFYEEGRFGDWPANHGIWSWDNANQEGNKPYRYIASTIFDPDHWLF